MNQSPYEKALGIQLASAGVYVASVQASDQTATQRRPAPRVNSAASLLDRLAQLIARSLSNTTTTYEIDTYASEFVLI